MKKLLFLLFVFSLISIPSFAGDEDSDYEEPSQGEAAPTDQLEDAKSPIGIVINIAARKMTIFEFPDAGDADEKIVGEFSVAVGALAFPSEINANYVTRRLEWNPWWYPPDSFWARNNVVTPPGIRNPLGPLKFILNNRIDVNKIAEESNSVDEEDDSRIEINDFRVGGDSGIRFHGTTKPSSIGTAASHGCFRMNNDDVKIVGFEVMKRILPEEEVDIVLKQVAANPGRTVVVSLPVAVPVDTIYKRVEVRDGVLNVYKNVYPFMKGDVLQMIEDELIARGYKIGDLDWDMLAQEIKNEKEDLTFDLQDLGVKLNKRYSRAQGSTMDQDM